MFFGKYFYLTTQYIGGYPHFWLVRKNLTIKNDEDIVKNISAIWSDTLKENDIVGEEIERTVKARLNQYYFRKLLLKEFDHCPFTHIKDTKLLFASHIKPWKKSSSKEKVNQYNGFLLSALYDQLFDKFIISFDENFNLVYANDIDDYVKNQINHLDIIKSDFNFLHREKYLKYHFNNFKEIHKSAYSTIKLNDY